MKPTRLHHSALMFMKVFYVSVACILWNSFILQSTPS